MNTPAPTTVPPRQSELRQGWKPLIGAMSVYAASPVIIAQTASVFIEPIMKQTGLSQLAISIGPVIFLTIALTQPLVAFFINRIGTRPLGIFALLVMLVGLVSLTVFPPSQLTFYAVGILMGFGGSFGYLATTAQYLSKWFSRNYGLTVGIVGAVGGIIPLILTPILGVLLTGSGWRSGYYLIAGFVLVVCLPLVFFLFREPKNVLPSRARESVAEAASQELEGVPARKAVRDPRYWLLSIAFLSVSIAVGGFLASIVPILISKGFAAAIAAGISIAMLAGVMAGRVAGGFLLDRVRHTYLVPVALFALSGISAVSMMFVTGSTAVLLVLLAVFLIGVSQGAEGDFPAFFFRKEFGRKSLATLSSWVYLLTTGFAGIGGFLFAMIRDSTGGFSAAIVLATVGFALGTVLSVIVAVISHKKSASAPATNSSAPLEGSKVG